MQNYIEMSQGRTGSHTVDEEKVTNRDWIRDYKINREQHYVEITQWNGHEKKIYFGDGEDKEMQEKMDKIQKKQFDKMVEAIEKCLKVSITNDAFDNLLVLATGAFIYTQIPFLGGFIAGLTLANLPLIPLKLKRDLHLIGWIIENRDDVDAFIRREVDEARDVDLSHMDPVVRYDVYPTDLTPYPEEIYNDGINLNNIERLDNETLRGIKKKVLKIQKKFRSNKESTSSEGDFSSYFD